MRKTFPGRGEGPRPSSSPGSTGETRVHGTRKRGGGGGGKGPPGEKKRERCVFRVKTIHSRRFGTAERIFSSAARKGGENQGWGRESHAVGKYTWFKGKLTPR